MKINFKCRNIKTRKIFCIYPVVSIILFCYSLSKLHSKKELYSRKLNIFISLLQIYSI